MWLHLLGCVVSYGFGIDWGSEFHKSTILVPEGGFRMVENDISKRKTPSMVSFCGKDRLLESQALAKFARATCQSFYFLNRFFADGGATTDFGNHPAPIEDQFSCIFPVAGEALSLYKRTKSHKLALANGKDLPESYVRFEELLAMMLQREKRNAASTGGGSYSAASFTLWDNSLTIPTRKQIVAAMRLAGLKPLGFIHENIAALIYLSMDRTVERETAEERVLVVNVGSQGLKLSLSKFDAFTQVIQLTKQNKTLPSVTNLKDFYSAEFSGWALDECLVQLVIAKFPSGRKASVSGFTTTQKRRLLSEANKVKEILSANRETSFIIEDFFEDGNLNLRVSRSEFESACNEYFGKFESLLKSFIQGEKFSRVEAIGGVARIPRVQEILKTTTQLPVGSRINGDEGPAMGAALYAANSTSGLKLKRIILNDGPNYSVGLRVSFASGDKPEKNAELFPFKTNYQTTKKINIKQLTSDLNIELTVKPGNYTVRYHVTGIEKFFATNSKRVFLEWKGLLTFELDAFGIPKLGKAELVLKESVTESVNKTIKKNETVAKASESQMEVSSEPQTVTKVHLRTEKLTVGLLEETYRALNEDKELFFDSTELLKAFRDKEEKEQLLAKLRNKLESFVYTLKATATDEETSHFLNENETKNFLKMSENIEDFLFAANSDQRSVEKMIFESEKLFDLYKERRSAKDKRAETWNSWHEFLKNATRQLDKLKREKPWVESSVLDKVLSSINSAKERIDVLHERQKSLKANEDPVFTEFLCENAKKEIKSKFQEAEKQKKKIEVKEEKHQERETRSESEKVGQEL